MKRKYTYLIILTTIALFLIARKCNALNSITSKTDAKTHVISETRKIPRPISDSRNYSLSPTGVLPVAKTLPKVNIGEMVIRYGKHDPLNHDNEHNIQNSLKNRPLPWSVSLDDKGTILKIAHFNSNEPVISLDSQAMGFFREIGYEILSYGIEEFSLDNPYFFKNLYKDSFAGSLIISATESNNGGYHDQAEIFPVMVRYNGNQEQSSIENIKYLNGSDIPMLLVKHVKRALSSDDLKSDRVTEVTWIYGVENTKAVIWTLSPFGRNDKEVEFINKSPHNIGASYDADSVRIKAWEKHHGRKYIYGDSIKRHK